MRRFTFLLRQKGTLFSKWRVRWYSLKILFYKDLNIQSIITSKHSKCAHIAIPSFYEEGENEFPNNSTSLIAKHARNSGQQKNRICARAFITHYHLPFTAYHSSGPGHGGMVTPIADSGSAPIERT